MSPSFLLELYLAMNLLLIVGYGIFSALRKTAEAGGIRIEDRSLILTAQLFIGLSILLPPLMSAAPEGLISGIQWSEYTPPAEMSEKDQSKTVPPLSSNPGVEVISRAGPVVEEIRAVVSSDRLQVGLSYLLLIVFTASVFFFLKLTKDFLSLSRVLRSANVLHSIGRVRVVVSEGSPIPFSVKMGRRAWVVIPSALVTRRKDFRYALKHELQHHRQRDTVWAVWIEFLVCIFFLNPALRRFRTEISELAEFSCDEALLGRKGISSHDYGSCLVRVAETALGTREMHVGTTCMASISGNPSYYKSLLRRRIEMFTSLRPRPNRKAGAVFGTLAVLFTVTLAFGAEKLARSAVGSGNPGTVVVDPEIQSIADSALLSAMEKQGAKSGFAIVADPMTGKILAIANRDAKRKGFWSLAQAIEPASTMKAIVASQAIENGVTTPDAVHSCENGTYVYHGKTYHEWKKGGWDKMTTTGAIAMSSDLCSMKIAEEIGDADLVSMLKNFGFGPDGSAKSFPQARTGTLPNDESTMVPKTSAGFGFLASPLEIVQAFGAIANGGTLLKAKVADATGDPEAVRRVMSVETSAKMKEILRQVILTGTGKHYGRSKLYSTAGKTASSYVPDLTQWDLMEGKQKTNFAGFVGFAPVGAPRVEIYVGIQDPNDPSGAHGSEHAVPIFKVIAEEVLKHLGVQPDHSSF